MTALDTVVGLAYLAAAVAFVLGLHLMKSPASARRGSRLSSVGMVVAVCATLAHVVDSNTITGTGWTVLGAGTVVGAAIGLMVSRRVQMTAVPQVVSLFNAVGGGAAALIAIAGFLRVAGAPGSPISSRIMVATILDLVIGGVTFSGSLIAAGKLEGWISGRPLVLPGGRVITAFLAAGALGGSSYLLSGADSTAVMIGVTLAALAFGITMVLPIGGADMPVVISLLNAFTGLAVAMAGFIFDSSALIIAGALVGASGAILTKLMADAMNRSIVSIMIGGFGTGDTAQASAAGVPEAVRPMSADDAAIQLAYATKVIIVPGYGLAAAQAQHEVRELADLLESRGTEVLFAIHPVAGRMPGHMNVLLAEANVSYEEMKEMDDVNPEFITADVALVVGANDVTNPAARRPGSPISGMPILDVDQAKSIIVIKRSMGHGYAGIDNELYADAKTGMFFADAKHGLAQIVSAIKALVVN